MATSLQEEDGRLRSRPLCISLHCRALHRSASTKVDSNRLNKVGKIYTAGVVLQLMANFMWKSVLSLSKDITMFSTENQFISVSWVNFFCLSDVTCPSPYLYVPGDVSGPGTLDYETHSMDNMTRYIRGFSNGINFIEKLPEISISHFCFVQVCRAVQ